MASNKELIDSILTVSPGFAVDGLNNAQLAEALKSLKEKPAQTPEDLAAKALADQAEEDALALLAAQEKANKSKPFIIAAGKAVTSLRGMLSEGEKVSAKDFTGGKDSFDRLVKMGHITK